MAHRSQWSHSSEVTVFFVSFSRYTVFKKANPLILIVNKLSQIWLKMRTEGDVGQCDLDLGSSHYIRADTGLPQHSLRCKHPDQPDMLDAINTLNSTHRVIVLYDPPDSNHITRSSMVS